MKWCISKCQILIASRMVLRVDQGKGKRDRYAMLSSSMLDLLRDWYRQGESQRKMLPGEMGIPWDRIESTLWQAQQLNRAGSSKHGQQPI